MATIENDDLVVQDRLDANEGDSDHLDEGDQSGGDGERQADLVGDLGRNGNQKGPQGEGQGERSGPLSAQHQQ